jgi:hypothetical protein
MSARTGVAVCAITHGMSLYSAAQSWSTLSAIATVAGRMWSVMI